jgi:NitT/TauT family transport system substrate-binding protein
MRAPQADGWTRRHFIGGLTVAGTAGLLRLRPGPLGAEPPPETTTLRLVVHRGSVCSAPMFLAEEFLPGEGFTEVQYLKQATADEMRQAVASTEGHFFMLFSAPSLIFIEEENPLVLLAGVHVGCLELFGTDRVRAVRDLKGKSVAVWDLGGPGHTFVASMAAYVGLDPRHDINWVVMSRPEAVQLLAEGKIDALLASPPQTQELRAKQIGHVVVNTTMDRPWSQYFCCIATGNREFVRNHPVATKRALRAILKATDVCAREPERTARFLVNQGHTPNYDSALQAMQEMEMAYGRWREYNPEDTVRFYALRLHEAGMLKSTPQKLIAQGTDWRFLNELKKELKG